VSRRVAGKATNFTGEGHSSDNLQQVREMKAQVELSLSNMEGNLFKVHQRLQKDVVDSADTLGNKIMDTQMAIEKRMDEKMRGVDDKLEVMMQLLRSLGATEKSS
jgi:hypothetical protein